MRIIVLLMCFGVVSKSSAEETASKTLTKALRDNPEISWDSTGQPGGVNIHEAASEPSEKPLNEISDDQWIYSNQWRPFIYPVRYYPYSDDNIGEVGNENTDNHEPNNAAFQHKALDINETLQSIYSISPRSQQQLYQPGTTFAYRYPLKPLRNQYASETPPVTPPIFYPPSLSIGFRRRFTNIVSEQQNSSDSTTKLSEPITSGFEERYSQILPPLVFPSMTVAPDRSVSYTSYGYPRHLYSPTRSAYVPPYAILPPRIQRSLTPPGNGNGHFMHFDREAGVANLPIYQKQSGIEQPVEVISPTHDFLQGVPNTFAAPNAAPTEFGRFPHGRPIIPRLITDRQGTEMEIPVPVDDVSSDYDISPSVPKSFAPPLQSPFQGFPFIRPMPIIPDVIPRPGPHSVNPPNPSMVPGIENLPETIPATEVLSTPVRASERLPLDSSSEGTSPEGSLPGGDLGKDSIQAVVKQIKHEENPSITIVPYEFGFDMSDGKGTDQHRMEASDAFGVVRGSYGYRDMFGVYRIVNYIADKNGYRAFIKSNEPGLASSGSADVIVQAEQPPPHAAEEESEFSKQEVIIVPVGTSDTNNEGDLKNIDNA